jgi:hypothetical protein
MIIVWYFYLLNLFGLGMLKRFSIDLWSFDDFMRYFVATLRVPGVNALSYILRNGLAVAALAADSSIPLIAVYCRDINILEPVPGGTVAFGHTRAVIPRIILALARTLVLSLRVLIGLYMFILTLLGSHEDDRARVWNSLNPL